MKYNPYTDQEMCINMSYIYIYTYIYIQSILCVFLYPIWVNITTLFFLFFLDTLISSTFGLIFGK